MKKLGVFLLVITMLLGCISLSVFAATVIASGTCGEDGDNLKWTLDNNGQLSISGTGYMEYRIFDEWKEEELSEKAKRVTIGENVKSIGEYAFSDLPNLSAVHIPASVEMIYPCVFGESVKTLTVSKNNPVFSADYDITFMNPNCTIDNHPMSGGGWTSPRIIGFQGSTAEAYAKEAGLEFKVYCPHTHTSIIAAIEKTCTGDGSTEGKNAMTAVNSCQNRRSFRLSGTLTKTKTKFVTSASRL